MRFIKFLLLSFSLLLSVVVFSQDLNSPSEFLGYPLGSRYSRHHQVVDYFKYVASTLPNQVKLENYGETYEHRPLYHAYVSSEENMKNLEIIRQNNLKNIGILEGYSTTDSIAIVWLSYNVHGNEASSTEASMKTIYTLLTQKQDWLKNTVVIIDPCINPDGRDRYINWFNETASTPYDIDQQASEHHEPWRDGRANHYLFDLNRDWVWASQTETASRLKVYNKWMPHIHVDFHEQGINEPYYFAPAAEPFHEVISDWQRNFQTQIGKNHSKYFDANGWLYFTRERFDLLYPSYGDTYPTYMGAIGMTYEQAGNSGGGLEVLNDENIILTLTDRLEHHTISGLSTVEMASKNAGRLNTELKKYFNNSGLKHKSFVLQGNEDKIQSLKELLDKHEITYSNATNSILKGFVYSKNGLGSLKTTEHDLVVNTNQPKGKMVSVLFEPNAKLSDSLTYDITAWSLPYAYGLEALASTTLVPFKTISSDETLSKMNKQAVAYVTKWNHLKDAEFLAALLKKDVRIRFSEKPLTTEDPNKSFDRGSLIITRSDNSHLNNFDAIVTETANLLGRNVVPIMNGFSKSGPDLGSPDIKLVSKKKVALLSGDHTSTLSYGALWHFFEQQLHYPVTSINTVQLGELNLDLYDILIIPDGNYKSLFNENAMNKLQSWVKRGGEIIAIEGGVRPFANQKGLNLKTVKDTDSIKPKNLIPYANRERESIKKIITGAVFKTTIDNTHPLAFGYDKVYYTLKQNNNYYQLLEDGYNIGYLDDKPINVSGFAGSDTLSKLKNTLILGEERLGNGNIIYMVDDILFRSFWEQGKLFLVNAIFFTNIKASEL